ncbi:hypothetical protein KAR91_18875 [Candidatus Pacearchaeota archaeon]|nr:hypothetical protein [Candidatus Pacearchaeota archaeon]
MATKKRKDQLERLLDWEREGGRLPETVELFNRKISPTFFLRELDERLWELELVIPQEEGKFSRHMIPLKHTTLIQLGLSILDAVQTAEKRPL